MSHAFRSTIIVSIALVTSCIDVNVPDGALILCGDDGGCPAPLTCEPAANLCVRSLVGDELTPPVATIAPALVGGPFIDGAGVITVDLAFDVAPLRSPTVDVIIDDVPVAFTVVGEGSAFSASLTTSRTLVDGHEGRLGIVVNAVDARGLPKRFPVGFVEVDLTAPVIGNVSFQRLPDPRRTPVAFDITEETVVGPNTEVRLSFSLNEDLGEEPTARLDGSTLALVRDGAVDNPVAFKADWASAGVVDGAFNVVVRVVDPAGNAVEEVIGTLDLDVTPPPTPAVDVDGGIVFERAPWGRAELPELDVFTVVGAAGSVPAGDFVIVTRDAAGLREIGRTRADASGFGGIGLGVADRVDLLLATGDLTDVFIVVADAAGNFTTPTRVTQTRWVASPGGKTVGNDLDNPHHFEDVTILTAQLGQADVVERGASDGLDAVDSNVTLTTGAGTFIARASDEGDALIPTGGVLVGTAVGHDPVRGLTVIFGGQKERIGDDNDGLQAFGRKIGCTDAVDDIFVRRGDGRFRRLALPAPQRPPPMAKARLVFDVTRNALVLVGRPIVARATRAPEMWAFDGTTFQRICTDAACVASIPEALQDMGLAADPLRRVLVAHGGALGAETFEFDGKVWRAVCGEGCTEASAGPGGLVFDDINLRVLWFDGASLSAWDGVSWTPLCADAACVASAPPPRFNTTAAWDRRRHRLVTFGGDVPNPPLTCNFGSQTFPRNGVPDDFVATPPFADTWEFDGTTWTQRVTPQSPASRSLHQMAWDERASAILVVGGDDCGCNQVVRDPGFRDSIDQDAWEYDGTTWRRVDVAPPPPLGFVRRAPLPLAFHTLVPSTGLVTGESRGVLAFGDAANPMVLIDDGRYYTAPRSPAGNTFLAPIADDDDGNLFLLNGGQEFANVFDGQATRSGCAAAADPVCSSRPDPFVKPPFFGYGAAHDGDRVVFFGGASSGGLSFSSPFSSTAVDSTYTFDPQNGLQRPCDTGGCGAIPGRRVRGRLAKTGTAGEVLLFGGFPGDDGTWIFSGTAWTQQTTTTTPARRQDLILTFDPERDAVLMTGGTDDDPIGDDRGRAAERPLPDALDLVYEWTGDWHEARVADPEGDGRPAPRFAAGAAHDPSGGVTIQGGVPSPTRVIEPPGGTRLADVWSWDGGSARRPAHRFRVTTAAAGLRDSDVITGATVRWFSENDDGAAPDTLVWDGSAWVDVVGVPCGEGCVSATLDAALTRRAINGPADELVVAVRGRHNGPAPGYASIRTNYVEVSIATRSP